MKVEQCPQCGAPAAQTDTCCPYCKAEFAVTTIAYLSRFDQSALGKYIQHFRKILAANPYDGEGYLGLGLCYLQSGLYAYAQQYLSQATQAMPQVGRIYYYFVLAFVGGRRLMTLSLAEIAAIEQYLRVAIDLDPGSSVVRLLLALVKRDYYERNGLRCAPPDSATLFASIEGQPIDPAEIERLRQCILVRDAECLARISSA